MLPITQGFAFKFSLLISCLSGQWIIISLLNKYCEEILRGALRKISIYRTVGNIKTSHPWNSNMITFYGFRYRFRSAMWHTFLEPYQPDAESPEFRFPNILGIWNWFIWNFNFQNSEFKVKSEVFCYHWHKQYLSLKKKKSNLH